MDKQIDSDFEETIERVTVALKDEGFGVLCDIDVKQTFKEKLDEEYRKYRILGACNPALAHEALQSELALGTLLPCNVVVYEMDDGGVGVSAIDPERLLSIVDNPDLDSISADVHNRFKTVMDTL